MIGSAVMIIVMAVLLASGLWTGFALGLAGLIGAFISFGSKAPYMISATAWTTSNGFVLTAIPLFLLMGQLMARSRLSQRLYFGLSYLMRGIPGGLLLANIAFCALFGAISGSSTAATATIGTLAIGELRKYGYDKRLTLGSVAAGGALDILIPPSITMIIYGVLADVPVAWLFMGGIIPGGLLVLIFMAYLAVASRHKKPSAKLPQASFKEVLRAIVGIWQTPLLIFSILGGIFGGIMTPTEAAAIGTLLVTILVVLDGQLTPKFIWTAALETLKTTSMILCIVVGAQIMATAFSYEGVARWLSQMTGNLSPAPMVVLALICLLYLILGCFFDAMSMIVMTIPFVLPITKMAGFDPLWFGIILVILAEIGLLTPPVGLNLFVVQGISNESLSEVVKGSFPFTLLMFLGIIILTAFPILVTWLPSIAFR